MKNNLSGRSALELKIRELELLGDQQLNEIKESTKALVQSVSPANLFRSAMKTVIGTPGLRSTAIDTAISAGAGLLGKKLFVRNSGSVVKKIAGTALQFLLTNFVRNKMPTLKEKIHRNNGVEK